MEAVIIIVLHDLKNKTENQAAAVWLRLGIATCHGVSGPGLRPCAGMAPLSGPSGHSISSYLSFLVL